ncbi:MAG: U32 family peptidase [Ruminococcaceae bacterium]|nr:U32 family peptidase [Oscillospiraceae bacterium]
MENKKIAEILSPVGSEEMLFAAVRSGADAVYLGAKEFNARRNAANFSDEQLKGAIEYCHIRGVKVYLTLNIILSDDELLDAFSLAQRAYNYGVDAIIAADVGLISLLKEHLPELPVHASTQMTVHTASAIPFLKDLGIKRVVLSRELSEKSIKEITDAAHKENIEVEVFVHGALCMSVSGQCLLSSMLGGRSGNRGLCAGPCRLPFAATGGNGYDLSLKDLSLIKHINKLTEIGVDSFKIEGRMKRPEYVAAATAVIREAITGETRDLPLEKMLNGVFSRSGFTDGYFTGNLGADMFGIRTKDDVRSANDVLPKIHELYRNERQSIGVTAQIKIKNGAPICLTMSDGTNTATAEADAPATAINRSITRDDAEKYLSKLGGTPFYLEKLDADIDDGLATSAATLNNLRRSCIETLSQLRSKAPAIKISLPTKTEPSEPTNKKPTLFCRLDSPGQIPKNCQELTGISLPLNHCLKEIALPENTPLWAELPRWIANDSALEKQLAALKAKGFTGVVCSNIAQLESAANSGLKVMANFSLNVYNSYTASCLAKMGCGALTLSPELLLGGAKRINAPAKKGIIAYGRLPLMVTVNCPIKTGMTCKECGRNQSLVDRKGISFPVRCQEGYSELLNSRPIYLADRLDELNGLDFITLYFTDETADEVALTIDNYKIGAVPSGEYTRGLYYRTVE